MGETQIDASSSSPTLVLKAADDTQSLWVQKCKLLVITGPMQGREFIVNKNLFTIGADPNNDLILDDSAISRCHCEIHVLPEGYVVRDLGSTNGTIVQGVKVTEAFLEQGTEIQLGQTRFVFCPLPEQMEYGLSEKEAFGSLLGKSMAMRHVFHVAERYAATDATVLIEGETGTGKEVLAEEIHRHSHRKDKPFIVIDCASLAKDLIASELFGHTKGAFTGATSDRVGAFQHANGGTVFLDEIGELDSELQPKLLRVLEKREVKRVGSNDVRNIDVRIISATNQKLEAEVNAGTFREDLYFRLTVVHIELPPLRQRKEDIVILAEKFLKDFRGESAMDEVSDFARTIEILRGHDWPGNVRELRNIVEIASYGEGEPLDLSSLLCLGRLKSRSEKATTEHSADRPFKEAKNELIADFEVSYIKDILLRCGGNVSRASREAGIERAYLQRLIRKYNLR
ncbi:MAG: sigma 54-interacting transcriptional regulator [Kiritimatiellia bacterium]|nr:sigma 54-interacting transcriptional regulator [Kiritimatiellia bacterium]